MQQHSWAATPRASWLLGPLLKIQYGTHVMLSNHVQKQGCQTLPAAVLKHKLLGPIHSFCRSEWAWESDFWKAPRHYNASPTQLGAPGVEPSLLLPRTFASPTVPAQLHRCTFRTNRPVLPGRRSQGKDMGNFCLVTALIVWGMGMAFKARVQFLIHLPACKPPDERWLWSHEWTSLWRTGRGKKQWSPGGRGGQGRATQPRAWDSDLAQN